MSSRPSSKIADDEATSHQLIPMIRALLDQAGPTLRLVPADESDRH
jgi:hypothetical protein